jgi:hypothetical protein
LEIAYLIIRRNCRSLRIRPPLIADLYKRKINTKILTQGIAI